MRTFIAFSTTEEIKAELVRIQSEITRYNPKLPVKWTIKNNMHVTLEFLGEIEEHRLKKLGTILQEVANSHSVFTSRTGGIIVLPNFTRPNVLAIEIADQGSASSILQKELRNKLSAEVFAVDDRDWRPHITLGRIKEHVAGIEGVEKIETKSLVWQVNNLELIKSELSANGPRYTVLNEYKLKGYDR